MERLLLACLLITVLSGCAHYVVEDDGVYYSYVDHDLHRVKRPLVGADPNTFTTLDNDDYGKDAAIVFYNGYQVPGADPGSFEFVGDLYAKDKFRAYYAGDSIRSSMGRSFRIIDSYYCADDKDVYYLTEPLRVCSPAAFRLLPLANGEREYGRWATDGCWYFYQHFKIPSTDLANIHLFRGSAGLAKDKSWAYFQDHRINFMDNVRILDTVDVATFTVTNYLDCKDKFGCINMFLGREPCEH